MQKYFQRMLLKKPFELRKRHYSSLPSVPGSSFNLNKGYLSSALNTNNKITAFKLSKHLSKAVTTNFIPNLNVKHSFIPTLDKKIFLLNLELTSDIGNNVKPLTYVCALDVSGSMDSSLSNSGDVEVSKFSRLDLIKHSMNTIISCLRPEDSLALVTFDDTAKLVLPPTFMNQQGKMIADKQISRIIANGGTNLWDGLNQSLDITESIKNISGNKFVILLTDGEPNINPVRGVHYEFIKKLSSYVGAPNCQPFRPSVNTFGYGYTLDSKLLTSLATNGGGIFAHIPDYTMCNTVMINFLSNCFATSLNNVTTNIKTFGCNILLDEINIGPIQSGQVRNEVILVKFDDLDNFSIDFSFNFDNSHLCYKINNLDKIENSSYEASKFFLSGIINKGLMTNDIQTACKELDVLVNNIRNLTYETSDKEKKEKLNTLLTNIKHDDAHNGQVYKAFSDAHYSRWGLHYLRYFLRSHELQMCSNFRDASLQNYGGKLFKEIRTEVEDIFNNIPVPQPSLSSTPFQGNFKQSFYSNTGPCFHGNGIVKLVGDKLKFVKDLVKGDQIINSDGCVSTIVCMVKTKVKDGVIDMVTICGKFKVTPWHPIRYKGKFVFPFDIKDYEMNSMSAVNCDYVYNIVLDKNHIITIDGVSAVTLGHGFNDDPVTKHPFFGTSKVIDVLKIFEGWEQGSITIDNYKKSCDDNGLVNSICIPLFDYMNFLKKRNN